MQRDVPFDKIQGLTKCTEEKNNEFVLHIKNEHDYRFDCVTRQIRNECITAVKECFFYATAKDLPIFGVQSSKYKMGDFV